MVGLTGVEPALSGLSFLFLCQLGYRPSNLSLQSVAHVLRACELAPACRQPHPSVGNEGARPS